MDQAQALVRKDFLLQAGMFFNGCQGSRGFSFFNQRIDDKRLFAIFDLSAQ